MTCAPLADTGLDAPVLVVLTLAVAFVLVGLVCLLRSRRSGGGVALLLMVLLGGTGMAVGLAPAPAASADCHEHHSGHHPDPGQTTEPGEVQTTVESEVDNSLTITQTSVMDALAPGAEPKQITGLVVNNGADDTFITAIVVDVVGVVKAAGAAAGTCDATDYVLLDDRMPVGEALAPDGGSAVFTGAAIGFNNKSTNQDACQGATVELRYRTSD